MTDVPRVQYWHLWVDGEGESHQTRCGMTHFEQKAVEPGVAPQWQGAKNEGAMSVVVMVLPAGWTGAWHENPRPQWIIPLSGCWYVESMDGTRVEMGPGELSFGGDQNSRQMAGKRGHRSGTVGDAPAVLMVVQIDDASAPAPPCSEGGE